MGGCRSDVRQKYVWVINHWMNWNNYFIYEAKVLNQKVSSRELMHFKNGGVLQGRQIGIKSP